MPTEIVDPENYLDEQLSNKTVFEIFTIMYKNWFCAYKQCKNVQDFKDMLVYLFPYLW